MSQNPKNFNTGCNCKQARINELHYLLEDYRALTWDAISEIQISKFAQCESKIHIAEHVGRQILAMLAHDKTLRIV